MSALSRRSFLGMLSACGLSSFAPASFAYQSTETYTPARITNDYTAFLPGERDALNAIPRVSHIAADALTLEINNQPHPLRLGELVAGWQLLAILQRPEGLLAALEKRATHRGVIAYVSQSGTVAAIPKWVGDLAQIRPRPVTAPEAVQLRRTSQHTPGPDVPGNSILNSSEDPCYENVAALGPEYIGWTLVANEQSGPERSLFLEPNGVSRQRHNTPPQSAWAPDELDPIINPPGEEPTPHPQCWQYVEGYSKRTLLGGFRPVADLGLWNPTYKCGYEVMCLLPSGVDATPLTRLRIMVLEDQLRPNQPVWRDEHGRAFVERYPGGDAPAFFNALLDIWQHWDTFFTQSMPLSIPDEWLLAGARAGIVLSRCSYRGLHPTYQVGEGAYTMIPERSHALFPVAHYEFIWAHQLWNLTRSSDSYFQFYLDNYVLPNGDFLYNTQDQVEAPFCVGMVLWNSARGFFFEHDLNALQQRLPVLRRMVANLRERYDYSKSHFAPDDPHHGLIWGSPEADLGDPRHNQPADHPFFLENAAGVWRGLKEHAASLALAARQDPSLHQESLSVASFAAGLRADVERSLQRILAARNSQMRSAGITPFTPEDLHHDPKALASYENHRFMEDWFLADWGDPALDRGHLRHRELAGMQLVGMETNDDEMRTSNFMAHGTLAVRIRQPDYRPFLLTLYGLGCFAQDSGNRYAPEDARLPGSFPGDGSKYWWSAVINSSLQLTMGLRWLLCYEESDAPVIHLQKAAPKHWFQPGEVIEVRHCPTRFGPISWRTETTADGHFQTTLAFQGPPESQTQIQIHLHIHRPDNRPLTTSTTGQIKGNTVLLQSNSLHPTGKLTLTIT